MTSSLLSFKRLGKTSKVPYNLNSVKEGGEMVCIFFLLKKKEREVDQVEKEGVDTVGIKSSKKVGRCGSGWNDSLRIRHSTE